MSIKQNKYTAKETKFQKYFSEKRRIGDCLLIETEFSLFNPMSLFTREYNVISERYNYGRGSLIGKIDVLFKYHGMLYVGEIKWTASGKDFWSALKVLGYCTYYNWQNETWGGSDNARPAILIPMSDIKLEHKIIANKLKIALFGIDINKKDYSLELVNPR